MDYDAELGVFTVRGQDLTTVSIGESKWCCFVEICSKLLPFVNRASIHNRVNRSKARLVLADKSAVAALKRQEVITKHTGKVYLISVENIALVLSLFDENEPRDASQDSPHEDDEGNQVDECGDKLDEDEECETEIGAEEVITESGLPESLIDGDGDGDGDDNSDEEDPIDGKIVESSQERATASSAPVPGPGRGRRRCPNCSTIVKSNQPTCTDCGKRLFTPGKKRRSGLPGGYARRMKRKRLEAKEAPVEEYDDDKQNIPSERPRRWRKWCPNCQAACASNAAACPRCGNGHLRETGHDPSAGGGPGGGEDDNDADDVDDMNDGGEEAMDTANGDDGEVDDGPKPKGGSRSKWCRHCALYMPENCTECTECNRPVKRKYRRRCATIASRPSTAKRRAALVARSTAIAGTPRHRVDADDAPGNGNGDNGDQGMGGGATGGKWCSRCQKTAPPLVTHCLICGKELKRVYRKRSAIWQQNQQQQVQQQQERLQERRRAGIKGLAGVAGGYEVTGSNGQHLNWSQRYNLTSFIPDDEHTALDGDGARPSVSQDGVEVRGGRAVVRRAELKRHESFMPRNASEAVGIVSDRPLLRRPIIDLPPRPTQATESEKLHYAQCFLNIKMGVSQSELISVINEARHRHQNSIDSAARFFDDVDGEYQATKDRATNLECEGKSLERRLVTLKQQLSAQRREVSRLNRLSRQTEHQANLYGRVTRHFHTRLVACRSLLDEAPAVSAVTATASKTAIPGAALAEHPLCSGLDSRSRLATAASPSVHGAIPVPAQSQPTALAAGAPPGGSSVTVGSEPANPAAPASAVPAETWSSQMPPQQVQVSREHSRDVLQHSLAMVS